MPPGTLEQFGLRTSNVADRVALRGVHLQARLSGMSLKATLDQTFINLEPHAIEAIYTFPLPEGAAVCGFEVITGERVLTGKIEETSQGIEQYEQAVSEGHGAFLMEQERPDVFTVRVGNLKPRQAATLRLTYVCPLERNDKSIRVAFPTTIAPRFAAAHGMDPLDAAMDADILNPPHVLSVPYGLSIEVDVALGRQLKRVSSPSHAISIANGEDATCRVTFAGGVAEMDRDVVLLLDFTRELQPCVQSARGPDGAAYLSVSFVPEFDEDELLEHRPTETVFVLDCSGSMMGESITQAIAALELCLRSLSIGDTFNICRFGSTWELMSNEPVVYSQRTLEMALKYVSQVRDLGGTVLHPSLEAIMTDAPKSGRVRQVIVLTDGQVANEPAVIELARKYRKHNRIFSFGIGSACSAFLVKGIARATGGAAEFITAGERIDDKVLRTFGRLTSPPVSDIAIDWDGCDVQTLAELPPIFDGDVLAVFGRSEGRLPRQIALNCLTPAGPRQWEVPVPPPLEDGGVIATMWARRTIQSLEEVNGVQTRARNAPVSREQEMLIRLSKQFGLLCSLTTFISVEHRSLAERNNGEPELRKVPVKVAAGWGAILDDAAGPCIATCAPSMPALMGMPMPIIAPSAAAGAAAPASAKSGGIFGKIARNLTRRARIPQGNAMPAGNAPPMPPPPAQSEVPTGGGAIPPVDDSGTGIGELVEQAEASIFKKKAIPPSPLSTADRAFDEVSQSVNSSPAAPASLDEQLKQILALQSAEGWFAHYSANNASDPIADSAQLAGIDLDGWRTQIRAALPSTLAADSNPNRIVRTAIVLTLLAVRFADRGGLWKRAHAKAVRWLAPALGCDVPQAGAWLADVRAKLGV